MTRGARGGKAGLTLGVLIPLVTSCTLFRPAPVTVQQHADGSATKMVKVGLFEDQAAARKRLQASIECPNYQIVELGLEAEQAADHSAYWMRYRCKATK